jgi:hypothetical protein
LSPPTPPAPHLAAITFSLDFFRVAPPPVGAGDAAVPYPTGVAVEYTPGAGADVLPPFLRTVITFGSDQAPMFLAKVTEALHHMDYEGRGDPMMGAGAGGDASADTESPAGPPVAAGAAAGIADADGGSPTVVLQPRSSRRPGSLAAALHDAADSDSDGGLAGAPTPDAPRSAARARAVASALAVTLGGATVTLDGTTPEAVRRGLRAPLGTPAPTPAGPAAKARTPAPTPAGHAAGCKAPAPTPARDEAGGEAASGDGDGDDAMADGGAAGAAPAAPAAAGPAPSTTARAGSRARAVSVDRARPVPATAAQPSRRSNRVAGSAVQPARAQSVRPHRGRRSVGHVVTADGFLHEASPRAVVVARTPLAAAAALAGDE